MGGDATDLIAGLIHDFDLDCGAVFDLPSVAAGFLDSHDTHPYTRTVLFDGVTQTLEFLKRSGMRIGVCTNKRETLSRAILSDVGILELVDAVAGEIGRAHV